MNYWLLKTEPSVYNWDDLIRDKKTVWDGVTSPAGLMFIRQIKKGDKAIIYHTGEERQMVGIAEVISNPYQDPKTENPKIAVFDIKPITKFAKFITLSEIKGNEKYKDFRLVKEGRLSVVPVPENFWDDFIKMSKG